MRDETRRDEKSSAQRKQFQPGEPGRWAADQLDWLGELSIPFSTFQSGRSLFFWFRALVAVRLMQAVLKASLTDCECANVCTGKKVTRRWKRGREERQATHNVGAAR